MKKIDRTRRTVRARGRSASTCQPGDDYRDSVRSSQTLIAPGDTAHGDTETLHVVARLARDQGVYRLVRETPIDPGDVANEMIRLIDEWRGSRNPTNDATDHSQNLFYLCGSTVRAHSWHSLAPAFFRAWETVDKKIDDPQALLIMTMFDGVNKDIKAWADTHADADSGARDRALNEMARTRGLYALLEKSGGTMKVKIQSLENH